MFKERENNSLLVNGFFIPQTNCWENSIKDNASEKQVTVDASCWMWVSLKKGREHEMIVNLVLKKIDKFVDKYLLNEPLNW